MQVSDKLIIDLRSRATLRYATLYESAYVVICIFCCHLYTEPPNAIEKKKRKKGEKENYSRIICSTVFIMVCVNRRLPFLDRADQNSFSMLRSNNIYSNG